MNGLLSRRAKAFLVKQVRRRAFWGTYSCGIINLHLLSACTIVDLRSRIGCASTICKQKFANVFGLHYLRTEKNQIINHKNHKQIIISELHSFLFYIMALIEQSIFLTAKSLIMRHICTTTVQGTLNP